MSDSGGGQTSAKSDPPRGRRGGALRGVRTKGCPIVMLSWHILPASGCGFVVSVLDDNNASGVAAREASSVIFETLSACKLRERAALIIYETRAR